MQHFFDIELAEKYGILEAILLNHFEYWIAKNKANEMNYYDGYYWTYNSTKAFSELFPYVSERKIQYALKHLKDENLIQTGNYNKAAYDRTLWYAFTDKGLALMQNCKLHSAKIETSIPQKCKMDNAKISNGSRNFVEPIPDNNSNNDSNNKTNKKRFTPPSREEVQAYCVERKNNVNADKFVNYYTSKGWFVGKSPMKDWKAAVRTWEKNNFDNFKKATVNEYDPNLDDIL